MVDCLLIKGIRMLKIFNCRRSSLAFIGMIMLFFLGYKYPQSIEYIALPISVLAGGVALSNAWQAIGKGKSNES